MKTAVIAIACAVLPSLVFGQEIPDRTRGVVHAHILPRFESLAHQSEHLANTAVADCSTASSALRSAYAKAFDAWLDTAHLRFGPTEVDNRAFALAFWPDRRGATPKALTALIQTQDPIIQTAKAYAEVSIAARGFYALEFLIYDPTLSITGDAAYRCALVRTITKDIENTTTKIHADWKNHYAARLTSPSDTGPYRSHDEAVQELFKALSTGLQFTSDTRLGRPLGTFDHPRPRRAEVWRSGRSSRHIKISLSALHDLAVRLAPADSNLIKKLVSAFDHALLKLAGLNDPVFASVVAPQARIKVEIVQQSVDEIRRIITEDLGPKLGVSAGFNAMDGD
ncbi:MAG TPA: peptidase M75 [Rhodobacteraceae bacterium]|nr:peptidase M75 [Paracoccaceae bacterium]|tara:strand:- start:2127 stop:3143 length:1017 start_codon:yes stop_codon:yes gene_type:complete